VCNGEIYNAGALRRRFAAYPFRTANDVEVVLPVFLHDGPHGLAALEGMFALAIVDLHAHRLVLARDRAGEKPLFVARHDGEWWFASEIRPLLEAGISRAVDRDALREAVALGYVREPRTPFASVDKVEAGTTMTVGPGGADTVRWWSPETFEVTSRGIAGRLDAAVRDAVLRQAAADVPVGVFASGGLDSSLLAGLLAAEGHHLPLFTVGFRASVYDERPAAERLARDLGLPIVTVEADDTALAEAHRRLLDTSAEPLTDPAALPTWLLARRASRDVRVVLSGEGADELFGGYPTYLGHGLADALAGLPDGVLATLRRLADLWPVSQGKVPLEFLVRRLLAEAQHAPAARHHAWFGSGLAADVGWHPDGFAARIWEAESDPQRAAMLVDYATSLRESLLPKIDRTTMQWGLEARAPFLDRTVTACALRLPTAERVGFAAAKVALRRVARRYVPAWVLRRRKRGLSVPVGSLLDGEFRQDVDGALLEGAWPFSDLVESHRVRQLVTEHRRGLANHARPLWILFTLATWHARWAGDDG
jgi:asparagine synthase (glutamine-hydrolysing)